MKKDYKIAVLPGDGIGPEIMDEAVKVLSRVAEVFDHGFDFEYALIGGSAWDKFGEHFPAETIEICESADAILFGSVGGPVNEQGSSKWKNCEVNALLGIRKHFNFNVNLRPVRLYKELSGTCILKDEIIERGVDIMSIRELSQDLYFGERKIEGELGSRRAIDTMFYDEVVIEKISRVAFEVAMKRRRKVTSVDKANVLDCSRLWREVVERVAKDYGECKLEHILVDNMSMQVIKRPSDFDVLLMPNMFGDIISDEVGVLAGSLGMLPSASLNANGFGLYEPSAGSAPDIAGKEIANPIGQILSAAMMLKYSFGMNKEHDVIHGAVEGAIKEGYRTIDISGGQTFVSTAAMGDAICKFIN